MTGSLSQVATSPTPTPVPDERQQQEHIGQEFYSALLNLDNTPIPTQDLTDAIAANALTIQCSSNYSTETFITTSTWSFCTTRTLYTHTSPGMLARTRRRAELTSIMTALYILTKVSPSTGQVTLSSNNKKALQDSYGLEPLGVTIANKSDYDLLLEIRRLRQSLPINITTCHGGEHNERVPEDTPMLLTPIQACQDYLQEASPANLASLLAQLPPSHVITVVQHNEIQYSTLRALIPHTLHCKPLQCKLQQDNQWAAQQFSMVDWVAYQRAFRKHPRAHRISIAKLSHSLWYTNKQNHRYYGETSLCPSCRLITEDVTHIFTCTQPDVVEARTSALAIFKTIMRKSTPPSLHDSIFSGLDQWFTDPTLPDYLAPTAGSLLPQLQCITKAFQAQSSIGWEGMFRGLIATYWTDAYCHTYESPSGKKHPTPSTISKLSRQWSTQLITQLWQFRKSVWAYRNAVVHG